MHLSAQGWDLGVFPRSKSKSDKLQQAPFIKQKANASNIQHWDPFPSEKES